VEKQDLVTLDPSFFKTRLGWIECLMEVSVVAAVARREGEGRKCRLLVLSFRKWKK
jgi:hypothetical protein